MERNIKIFKRPKLNNPSLIVGWPGMGEVAFKAVTYLIDKLKAEELAEIDPRPFFYRGSAIVDKGVIRIADLPVSKFFFWKDKDNNNDLIFFFSNAQPDLSRAESYARAILDVAADFKVKKIYGFASLPKPIDHIKAPEVFASCTHTDDINKLKGAGITIMERGEISGMNGIFVAMAKKRGLKGICLLGEIPIFTVHIENPKAALAVLKVFSVLAGVNLDLSELKEQAEFVEAEINKLIDYVRGEHEGQEPIGEEEIEKIKKLLSQHSRLPSSINARIEKLFEMVKSDITKAGELKKELDKWSVYKDYEDRFLDLFKGSGKKDN
ncbi:MAG: PAC2 family protein [Candidatus Omnitrophica bacterium]|nr:PAC2 family protein [Candidatus Omnitrophota bacterium]